MLDASYMGKYNFLIVTLDSLRYDVTQMATTPNFHKIFSMGGLESFQKAYAQATFTLPSHVAMFKGFFPDNRESSGYYNRSDVKMFSLEHMWTDNERTVGVRFPEYPNIIRGFSGNGYYTIGLGSVGWFNTSFESSRFWKTDYFEEFYWGPELHEQQATSFEQQIEKLKDILTKKGRGKKKLVFVNCGSTHFPYAGHGRSIEGQVAALEYVDYHIMKLVDLLPLPLFMIVCSDHGDCFGENGLIGHGFFHEKVMEIPMAVLDLFS
jgi:arylsulfatase A-like enzyme